MFIGQQHRTGTNMGGQSLIQALKLQMLAGSAQTACLVIDTNNENMILLNELALSRVPNPNLPGMVQNLKCEIDKMQSMKPYAKTIQDYQNVYKCSISKKKKIMVENAEMWYNEANIIIQNNQQNFLNNGVKLDLVKQQFARTFQPPKIVFTIQDSRPQQQMSGMLGMMPQMPQFGSEMPQQYFGQQPNAFQSISINEPSNGQQYKMPSQNQLFQFK